MGDTFRNSVLAGAVAGTIGILFFGIAHYFVLAPTWNPLATGFLFGPIVGAVIGWAYYEVHSRGGLGPLNLPAVVFSLVLLATFVPIQIYGMFFPPDIGQLLSTSDFSKIDPVPLVAPVVLALPPGLLAGWILTRNKRATIATGVAALIFAFSLGHNIYPIAANFRAGKMWAVMLGTTVVSGLVLGFVHDRSMRKSVTDGGPKGAFVPGTPR
ncbi:MAG: hypothetical protein HY556_09430 [Euryarchaeota archaeon]|nr:hypothetical protein [Euryarchaeota archaeon]